MKRHDTPPEVAAVLARHVPRNISSLLDPSVGSGVLISPFVSRLSNSGHITCVDISPEAIAEAKENLGNLAINGSRLEFVVDDFLNWSEKNKRKLVESFDVVVLNPPFAAKLNEWCCAPFEIRMLRSRVPLEIAFLFRSIELTKPGGSVLAIVPASVISGEQTRWVREALLKRGAIKFVRELPLSTFPGVECRFYLLIYVKGTQSQHSVLCNHDLDGKERMRVSTESIRTHLRLDFSYFESVKNFERLRSKVKGDWLKLEDQCTILRGRVASPEGAERGMHTTDLFDGHWFGNERHVLSEFDDPQFCVQSCDILMSRVGRRCLLTCGQTRYALGVPLSDCVICFRPREAENSIALLFSMRIFFGSELYQSQLIRGSGASFVTIKSLQNALVPKCLTELFRPEFNKYLTAARKHSFREMCDIEMRVRKRLPLV